MIPFSTLYRGAVLAAITLLPVTCAAPYAINTTQGIYQVPLDSYFTNKAFGLKPGEAAINAENQSIPAHFLPQDGTYTSTKTGVDYLFPGYQKSGKDDNTVMAGQTIVLPSANYFSLQMLITGDTDSVSGDMTFHYADNTTSTAHVRSEPFYSFLTIYKGEIILPSYYTSNDNSFNTSNIFEYVGPLDHTKKLESITLPNTSNKTESRLHLFSMTLGSGSGIGIQYVRPTQKFTETGAQVVEVTVNNAGSSWISGSGVEISIDGPGIKTITPGRILRLAPGDQKKINVGVTGSGNVTGTVTMSGALNSTLTFQNVKFGLQNWTSDLETLNFHESPEWFDDAKFGIFIHWGPYSVPGWGNSTPYEVYAEWYWWYQTHHNASDKADIYDYDLETYGPNVVYDDFFANFTAANWNPKEWVDLIAESGAQYFVFTTKHHDGFANFDTKSTTHRNALHYGPKRDLLKDLFDAAKKYQPHLHRGTYFSLPEWFNPDFGPYGFAQSSDPSSVSWPGMLARNPYTGLEEPYTGRANISDFVEDLMVPQMEMLAYDYETDILWCDCGAANGTAAFAASWFNWSQSQNRSVTMNSRCGIPQGSDFDTPEYATFSSVSPRKWESNEGLDLYSYGYNRATPTSLYMNASTIIQDLVDIVSKNGNFLLDFGPMADGTIVGEERANLKEAGEWVRGNAEGIFNTTYWFVTPESGNLRFTQKQDAFFIHSLTKPNATLTVDVAVPILSGDRITMLGAGNGTELAWTPYGKGINITVPEALASAGKYCWSMKVEYVP